MADATHRLEHVDLLLAGGTVVTMDQARRVISEGGVAIRGSDIIAVGPLRELLQRFETAETVHCEHDLILPGLVNTHTHAPMSLLRGLADDLRLDVWLYGYILPVEQAFVTPEFCFLGTTLACAEMLRGGTTTFVDMYYFEEEVAWAASEAGLRAICGETVVKYPTPDAASYEQGLQYCDDFCAHWQDHPLVTAVPAPHSIYMTTPDLLEATLAIARSHGVPQLMHVSESEDEAASLVAQSSLRPVRWLHEHGLLDHRLVAAHCVHVNAEEIQLLARHGVGVAHNPTSNLKLASGIAPIAQMLQAGVRLGIGTDGCASNNDLDMFEEMRLAALLPKVVTGSPVAVPAEEALAMATIQGARAIGLDHLIGSLEVGKRADVVVVRDDGIHSQPTYAARPSNIYSRLVYTSRASDVRHVYVNGRNLVRDGALLSIDLDQTLARAQDLANGISHFVVAREQSVLEKLVAIAPLQQRESFEVQAKGVLRDREQFERGMQHPDIHMVSHSVRDQFDTYFIFVQAGERRLRYREDQLLSQEAAIPPIYNLVLTEPAKNDPNKHYVVLGQASYSATADRSLRFYREYFSPDREVEITKRRERYHIRYRGLDFAVNLDHIRVPREAGPFVEVKSRTW
ncbi:MAG: amidohydrolase family protein, partial [Chloroflexi bacterium]|nr:amidohydrolase family protein [Chloroflexota bacterium]